MRAEFYRAEDPDRMLGAAEWVDGGVRLEGEDREVLERIFRPVSVVVDDPSTRSRGTSGPTVIEPGSIEWFRSAAVARGEQEGLGVRFVTDLPGGWDPAGSYNPLRVWTARREGSPGPRSLGTSRA